VHTIRYFTFLLVSLLSFSSLQASEYQVTAVSTEHRLLQYLENGELKGPSAELFKLLMKEAGLTAKVDFMPWPRAYNKAVKTKNTLIFSMVRTKEREENFLWLLEVSELVRAFIWLKSRTDLSIKTIDEAKSNTVAVVRDSYTLSSLKRFDFPQENIYLVANTDKAIALFLNGKVDLLFSDPNFLKNHMAALDKNSDEIVNSKIFPETRRRSYIAMNRNSDQTLVDNLFNAAESVKKLPVYEKHFHFKPLID
jgi:polar amino acid transport system substrate-binding protein